MVPLGKSSLAAADATGFLKWASNVFRESEAGQLNCPALFGGNALERAAAPPTALPQVNGKGERLCKNSQEQLTGRQWPPIKINQLTQSAGICHSKRMVRPRVKAFQPDDGLSAKLQAKDKYWAK